MGLYSKDIEPQYNETKKLIKSSKKQNDALAKIRSTKNSMENVGDVSVTLHQMSERDEKRRAFEKTICMWINETTAKFNVHVRDLAKDCKVASIFLLLIEQHTKTKINYQEYAVSELAHKENVKVLLKYIKNSLGIVPPKDRDWTVQEILRGNWIDIYQIAAALAHYFKCPYKLPSDLSIAVIKREKIKGGDIVNKTVKVQITDDEEKYHLVNRNLDDLENKYKKRDTDTLDSIDPFWTIIEDIDKGKYTEDVIDQLYSQRPEKVDVMKKAVMDFANNILVKYNIDQLTLDNMSANMRDGVNFIYLISDLTNVFISPHNFFIESEIKDHMALSNIKIAMKYMELYDIDCSNVNPIAILEKDEKSVVKLLYILFQKMRSEQSIRDK